MIKKILDISLVLLMIIFSITLIRINFLITEMNSNRKVFQSMLMYTAVTFCENAELITMERANELKDSSIEIIKKQSPDIAKLLSALEIHLRKERRYR